MLPQPTLDDAATLLRLLRARGWMLATAESCTGGLIAGALTHQAGASDVFDRGFVTYSNEAKADLLGVPMEVIGRHGAVSEQVARAMAEGALARSRAALAISVTGIAGPGGGSPAKPVGLVWFGCATHLQKTTSSQVFKGDRESIRDRAVEYALAMARQAAT